MSNISLYVITVVFSVFVLIQISCKKEGSNKTPTVKTLPVIEISSTTAKSGGDITDDGGSDINSKGIVWSTDSDPTIENHSGITMDGVGQEDFISTLTNLSPATQYYVKAYATNSAGRAYGEKETFITGFTTTSTYPPGFVHCDTSNPTAIVEVASPATGRIWMDRNLGAAQAATSSLDAAAYGDLYQWGRFADGHQCRNSATTSTLSSTDQPGHGHFIKGRFRAYDWRSPGNNNLWQSVSKVNNPCPTNYRLPTLPEWNTELMFWSNHNAEGAMDSPLKLPMAGLRNCEDASLDWTGSVGCYWSGTANPIPSPDFESYYLEFDYESAGLRSYGRRASGFSVRCIKFSAGTEAE